MISLLLLALEPLNLIYVIVHMMHLKGHFFCLSSRLMPKLELGQALQKLKHLLPNPNCDEWRFRQWWESHRQAWTAQLRTVMIKHGHIGYD
jgi:hypothetical protein